MINKPDKIILSALSQLQSDSDFQIVLRYLSATLETLKADGAYLKEEHMLRWNQGATQALGEFVDLANNCRELLHKVR